MPTSALTPPPPLTRWDIAWRNLVALLAGGLIWVTVAEEQQRYAAWLPFADLLGGVVMLVLYQFRRRWPTTVAAAGALIGLFSVSSAGYGVMAYISLATRRRLVEMVPIGLLSLVTGQIYYETAPEQEGTWLTTLIFGIAMVAVAMAIGMYIGSRRDMIAALKDRAERAEREQELYVARAQAEERTRIAREMHDVLAHRMSLVAMHAGALAYRDDLSLTETRGTAEIIQANSHRALTDLREILGVLRDTTAGRIDDNASHRPQPTLCDLDELIADERNAGGKVELHNELATGEEVPLSVGRAAYRLVQESLTNARKHSPDTKVTVTITGAPGVGLNVEVRNPLRVGTATAPAEPPGAGMGLLGLAERVTLAHGRFEHGRTPGGQFLVRAWLPWAS